jgi:hypothetical protein
MCIYIFIDIYMYEYLYMTLYVGMEERTRERDLRLEHEKRAESVRINTEMRKEKELADKNVIDVIYDYTLEEKEGRYVYNYICMYICK